jgi:AcrR family transcriptional regulator
MDAREKIIETAMRLFSTQGYGNTSLSQVAKEAQVSKALIFWHFENKESLFRTAVQRTFEPYIINVVDDLEGLVGVCAGVNVKLAKCGGIAPARRMLERARELGFRRFLGCMEETSVGIAGSAVVASLADWVDLDGCLLLASDPFDGLVLGDDCRWILSEEPGLGVRPKAG